MLINTDIQLALAQIGIIIDIDKRLRNILDEAATKRMITNKQRVVELLEAMYEAEEHLLRILQGAIDGELYVVENGKKLTIGEAYERYIEHKGSVRSDI